MINNGYETGGILHLKSVSILSRGCCQVHPPILKKSQTNPNTPTPIFALLQNGLNERYTRPPNSNQPRETASKLRRFTTQTKTPNHTPITSQNPNIHKKFNYDTTKLKEFFPIIYADFYVPNRQFRQRSILQAQNNINHR